MLPPSTKSLVPRGNHLGTPTTTRELVTLSDTPRRTEACVLLMAPPVSLPSGRVERG